MNINNNYFSVEHFPIRVFWCHHLPSILQQANRPVHHNSAAQTTHIQYYGTTNLDCVPFITVISFCILLLLYCLYIYQHATDSLVGFKLLLLGQTTYMSIYLLYECNIDNTFLNQVIEVPAALCGELYGVHIGK